MFLTAATDSTAVASIATPTLWAATIGLIVVLFAVDFAITRRPHEVSMREAIGWSTFYIAVPVAFGAYVWRQFGSERGLEFYTGYLIEKSLSVDNLFVFMLLLSAFAVPRVLQQRVLLIGVAGALVMRAALIAVGAAMVSRFSWAFLVFGVILLLTAIKVFRDASSHSDAAIEVSELRSVRFIKRFWPVTDEYHGTQLTVLQNGKRALTPLALVAIAILATDLVFAVDSVPAVYGITGDPYLVFATNAFALLGLRALYFVLEGAVGKLVHLGYGLAAILALIAVKLILHWAHGVWPSVPTIPTLASLAAVIGILVLVTITSLFAIRSGSPSASGEKDHSEPAATDHTSPS